MRPGVTDNVLLVRRFLRRVRPGATGYCGSASILGDSFGAENKLGRRICSTGHCGEDKKCHARLSGADECGTTMLERRARLGVGGSVGLQFGNGEERIMTAPKKNLEEVFCTFR